MQETPSKGRSRKIMGIKSGRIHHLLSDGEYYVFLLLEYDKSVLNIYEQHPLLPRDLTVQIANDMGVIHPKYRRVSKKAEGEKRTPLPNKVMSTDFLIEKEKNGGIVRIAIWVKTAADTLPSKNQSKNKTNLHKAEIEVTVSAQKVLFR